MTCQHKVKTITRSEPYIRQPRIRRREYQCNICDKILQPTYEGTMEDLEAWIKPQARKEVLREVVMGLERLR